MTPELKSLHSLDIDISSFWPEDETNFGIFFQAFIGPVGEESEETYGFIYCSPSWIGSNLNEGEMLINSKYIISQKYDIEQLQARISTFLQHCTDENWVRIARRVSQLGNPEYDPY